MKDRVKLACAALVTVVLAAGCGGGGGGGGGGESGAKSKPNEMSGQPPAASPSGGAATPAPAGGQTVMLTGKVNLEGAAPGPTKIKLTEECSKARAGAAAMTQDIVVDGAGMLQNVFVYVKTGLEGQTFDTPTEPVVFDQKGCTYSPHVFGIMVNQPFKILNSDPILHNIHALPKKGEFNLGMPRQGMEFTKNFPEAQMPVHIKCDVHPWMSAWCGVLTHPFYGVTGEHGAYEIKNLPAGTYTIEAWHEKYGTQTQQVTVGATPTQEVNFTFKATGT